MIIDSGKLQASDVLVEIEDAKIPNRAPKIIAAERIQMTTMPERFAGTGISKTIYQGNTYYVKTGWTVPPGWYEATLATNAAIPAVLGYATDSTVSGVPGTMYSASVSVNIGRFLQRNRPHTTNSPRLRAILYATNGVSGDVAIATANVQPASTGSSGGFTSGQFISLVLDPIAAMPSGKTFFKLALVYDNAWNTSAAFTEGVFDYEYWDYDHTTPIFLEPTFEWASGINVYSVPEATGDYVQPTDGTPVDIFETIPTTANIYNKNNFKFSAKTPVFNYTTAGDTLEGYKTYGARARAFVVRTQSGVGTATIAIKAPNGTTYTSTAVTPAVDVPVILSVDAPASAFQVNGTVVVTVTLPSDSTCRAADVSLKSKKVTDDYEYG